jgi:hypothetical protein
MVNVIMLSVVATFDTKCHSYPSLIFARKGSVFTIFLRNLRMGTISKSVCNSQTFLAYCNGTL